MYIYNIYIYVLYLTTLKTLFPVPANVLPKTPQGTVVSGNHPCDPAGQPQRQAGPASISGVLPGGDPPAFWLQPPGTTNSWIPMSQNTLGYPSCWA